MKFYTLWKQHGDNEAILLDDEDLLKTKAKAFKRAKELRKDLIYGSNDVIIVRLITVGNYNCKQWTFEPTA